VSHCIPLTHDLVLPRSISDNAARSNFPRDGRVPKDHFEDRLTAMTPDQLKAAVPRGMLSKRKAA
jgi:hypothetical protein